jgi:hypothetical protein
MNDQSQRGGFEQDLLDRLKLFVAERDASIESEEASAVRTSTARRLAPRLAVGGAVAMAAAGVVLALSAGSSSTSSAFAVETGPGGGTLVSVNALEDAAGLEGALEEAGIHSQVTWLQPGSACREPHFTGVTGDEGRFLRPVAWDGTTAPAAPAGTVTIAIGLQEAEKGELPKSDVIMLSVDPSAFSADQTLVLSGSPAPYGGNPEGGYTANVKVAEGAVGACEAVSVPAAG